MSKIDHQALREAAERAIPAMERLLMLPVDDDLISEQELKDYGVDIDALNAFKLLAGPETVLELLDERERNQQYIKRSDQENEDIALTVGKLRVELEAAKSKLNEQREYYEGVISDGSKRIAELRDWNAGLAQESLTYQQRVAELEVIKAASEKLVRCKGRYHSEQNYRALAALFGVTVPDLPPMESEPVSQTYKLPELIEGMEVSIDVSTCDADLGNRYFGTVTEALELDTAKNGYILLVQDAEPNFDVNGNSPVTPDGWISCSDRMPVIGELNWRTSFPLLVTCEIGVIPAYYGFVRVNGNKHYGFMESLKYGDDSGNHPQTNEYDLISNVTHWMPLPEPPQEVNHG